MITLEIVSKILLSVGVMEVCHTSASEKASGFSWNSSALFRPIRTCWTGFLKTLCASHPQIRLILAAERKKHMYKAQALSGNTQQS